MSARSCHRRRPFLGIAIAAFSPWLLASACDAASTAASEAGIAGRSGDAIATGRPHKLERVEVNATRIDGLNNQGLLQGGENAPLYHDVITRFDIERMGISSMEELFRNIPQTSSSTTRLQDAVNNTNTSGGLSVNASTIGLRGFPSAQTVMLINGRALPRTGLVSSDGADVSRIPIAAIERVELLPYAGSAIYGAGAIGGAINVILRKDYIGRDLTTYAGTSTAGGATEYRVSYLEGRSVNHGKTNLTLTLSYQYRDALRAEERDYLDAALRRYGPNSTAVNSQGVRLFESLIIPSFAGAPATIVVGNPPSAPAADLGIPGAPGVRYAAVPAGTTADASLTLTPASFTATVGKPALSPRHGRSILYEPIDALSFSAQVEHLFIQDRLEAYGEFTFGRNRKDYSMPQQLVLSLAATDPLNPFRSGVTPGFVGRPVQIYFDTPDIRDPSVSYRDESARAVMGLKGHFTPRWEWSVDGVIDYAHSRLASRNPQENLHGLVEPTPFSNPGPRAPVAVRRAVYPILADHARYPLSEADSSKYFEFARSSGTNSIQSEANVRVLGELMRLPAGPLRTSLTGKYQDWKYRNGQVITASSAWSQLVHNGPVPSDSETVRGTRRIWMGALEVSLPLIGRPWRPLPVESLELQGSISLERDRSGSQLSAAPLLINEQSADSRVLAGKLQITRDVAVRASYSEGFYPPEWAAVSQPVLVSRVPGVFPDPKRGNTLQFTPTMTILQGGNPTLKSEAAESEVFGLILTPRFLRHFSLNMDYWRIAKVDAVTSQAFANVIANPDAYGFLITREAPTAEDTAQGWLGRITAIDARAFNAARTKTEGVDFSARYLLETRAAGSFGFIGRASFVNHFRLQPTPSSPAIDVAGGSGPVRWRGNASITWSNDRWSGTVTARYVGPRSTRTTAPSPSYPGGTGLDGDKLQSILRWDVQTSYEIPYATNARSGKAWIHGVKFTLGVLNVLDHKPTFVSNGAGYYDVADDPRQRFVYVQIKKSF